MKQLIYAMFVMISSLMITACGGGSGSGNTQVTANGSVPPVIFKNAKAIEVADDNKTFRVSFEYSKNLNSNYKVELSFKDLTVSNCPVDPASVSFSPSSLVLDGEVGDTQGVVVTGAFQSACPAPSTYTVKSDVTTTRGSDVQKETLSNTSTDSGSGSGGSGGGSTPPPASGYALINASELSVTQVDYDYELKVQLVKDGFIRQGETIRLMSFDNPNDMYGSFSNYSAETGADGFAVFRYRSPEMFPSGSKSFEVVYMDENNATYMAELKINYISSGGSVSPYTFKNVSHITIGQGSQKEDIRVQLVKDGIPVSGKTVTMEAFDEKYGTILNSYSVSTDSTGHAVFNYMAPLSIVDINSTVLSLKLKFNEDGTGIETEATVTFDEQPVIASEGPSVILPTTPDFNPVVIDENSKTVVIDVKVFKDNAPYTSGEVKVSLPDAALTGVDVGVFESYSVNVNDQGIASFIYTGPGNVKQTVEALLAENNQTIFKFYHSENNVSDSAGLTVKFVEPSTPYISRNYALDLTTSGDFSMGIPNIEKSFNVELNATDAAGNSVSIDNENITEINVTTLNSSIAQIYDSASDSLVNSLTLTGNTFILRSKTLSGLVPVKISMDFVDVNGELQNLTKIVNVRVYSGPPTAISISYVGTTQDVNRSKYIETLVVSATDEYGNKVNTRPYIAVGAIAGYTVDGSEANGIETNNTRRLFYGKDDIDRGVADGIITNKGNSKGEFEGITPGGSVFKYVNAEGNNTDKLIVFGARKNYEAMGKWDFDWKTDTTLTLIDDYDGSNRNGLYFAVGHNYYQDLCRQDGREWIGTMDSDSYQLDEQGSVIVKYTYDYHLTGKDVMIWVNLDAYQPDTGVKIKVGEATKHTLRGMGLVAVPEGGYSLAKGASGYGTFVIWHDKAPERYRNAHFGYGIKSGSTCAYTLVAISNDFDARTCDNREDIDGDGIKDFGMTEGTSYVTYFLQAPPDQGCTFNITNILPSNEF